MMATIKLSDDIERGGMITAEPDGATVVVQFYRAARIGPYATITLDHADAADLADEIADAVDDAKRSDDEDEW